MTNSTHHTQNILSKPSFRISNIGIKFLENVEDQVISKQQNSLIVHMKSSTS